MGIYTVCRVITSEKLLSSGNIRNRLSRKMNESGVLGFQILPTGRLTYKEANSLVGTVSRSPAHIIIYKPYFCSC